MITSPKNNFIKNITRLSCKKERQKQRLFIAEGLRVCTALIDGGLELVYLLLSSSNSSDFDAYHSGVTSRILIVSDQIIKKISNFATPVGIVGIFKMKEHTSTSIDNGLILYGLQDPGNAGTLMRSCAAMNKKTIIFVDSVDPYHPKVVQAAAGSFSHLDFIQCSWPDLISMQNDDAFKIGALVVSEGKNPNNINFDKMLLMVGNEGNGIPQHIVDQCDERITLDMPGNTQSLNAAVAGSIALYLSVNN